MEDAEPEPGDGNGFVDETMDGEPEAEPDAEPEPLPMEPDVAPPEPDVPPAMVRTAPVYNGTCPDFVDGRNTGFESAGLDREFLLELPANPEGAPVVFAWHWLGGNAQQLMLGLGLGQLADEEGAIVIAPESQGAPFEWRFTDSALGNADLKLFEDLLACLDAQFGVDLSRIHSTGHSAGGLWTSYLTIHKAQWLASTFIMSGGADARTYATPSQKIPVLLAWGGDNDTYGSFNFADASRLLSERLRGDDHFVVHCVHSNGHRPPPSARALLWDWFEAHPADQADEPFEAGLPQVYPDFCSIP